MITVSLRSFSSVSRISPSDILNVYSVARWQPRGYGFQILRFFVPTRGDGSAIRHIPPDEFLKEYVYLIARNVFAIDRWICNLHEDVTLLCWCNPQRQRQYPSLMCHTILIGYYIEDAVSTRSLGIEVEYLDGRDNPVWSRDDFKAAWRELLKREGGIA